MDQRGWTNADGPTRMGPSRPGIIPRKDEAAYRPRACVAGRPVLRGASRRHRFTWNGVNLTFCCSAPGRRWLTCPRVIRTVGVVAFCGGSLHRRWPTCCTKCLSPRAARGSCRPTFHVKQCAYPTRSMGGRTLVREQLAIVGHVNGLSLRIDRGVGAFPVHRSINPGPGLLYGVCRRPFHAKRCAYRPLPKERAPGNEEEARA